MHHSVDKQPPFLATWCDTPSGRGKKRWTRQASPSLCLVGPCPESSFALVGQVIWVSTAEMNWIASFHLGALALPLGPIRCDGIGPGNSTKTRLTPSSLFPSWCIYLWITIWWWVGIEMWTRQETLPAVSHLFPLVNHRPHCFKGL